MIVYCPLGLGDTIICNGLIRFMAEKHKKIIVPVVEHNEIPIQYMLSDLSNIEFKIISDETSLDDIYEPADTHLRVDNLDLHNYREVSIYNSANVDYSVRYTHNVFPRNDIKEHYLKNSIAYNFESNTFKDLPQEYAFCCFDTSIKKYNIQPKTNLPCIHLNKITPNIFDWLGIIQEASEYHVVDTSVFHIIKQLNNGDHIHRRKPKFLYDCTYINEKSNIVRSHYHRLELIEFTDEWEVIVKLKEDY